jgi:hypothetical protein
VANISLVGRGRDHDTQPVQVQRPDPTKCSSAARHPTAASPLPSTHSSKHGRGRPSGVTLEGGGGGHNNCSSNNNNFSSSRSGEAPAQGPSTPTPSSNAAHLFPARATDEGRRAEGGVVDVGASSLMAMSQQTSPGVCVCACACLWRVLCVYIYACACGVCCICASGVPYHD